jgi:hypothetical protein
MGEPSRTLCSFWRLRVADMIARESMSRAELLVAFLSTLRLGQEQQKQMNAHIASNRLKQDLVTSLMCAARLRRGLLGSARHDITLGLKMLVHANIGIHSGSDRNRRIAQWA